MILANYTQENRNCYRVWGQAFTNPLAVLRPQVTMNFYTPDTALTGLSLSGFPHGYNTDSSWQLPLKSGGVAATQDIRGSGTLSASALAVKLAIAALTGSGDITNANASLIVSAIAALTGSGGVTNADLQAFLLAVASITGSGGVSSGAATGLGAAIAALTGDGSVSSTASGIGAASADLTVTGTGLSTANVGDAVWSYLIENGLSAEQVQRVLLAVAAGDATGLEGASPVFKGQDGATTRVAASYSAGTRDVTTVNGG